MTIEAYPLAWPDGWPRRDSWRREGSRYEVSFADAAGEVRRSLRLMSARTPVISTNVPLRRDGLPYADYREPKDPGVAVYWDRRNSAGQWESRVIACDVWRTVRENMRAVGLTLEAFRMLERTGVSEVLDRAYSGFAALPPPADHWSVLGLERGASADDIRRRQRELAIKHHPDRGGVPGEMERINFAAGQALGEIGR